MQRQSLGSPVSKFQGHGGPKEESLLVEDDDSKRKDLFASSSSSAVADYDEDNHKPVKPHRLSSPPPIMPYKFIHLIPLLTLICFLVLFLFSHTPSQSGQFLRSTVTVHSLSLSHRSIISSLFVLSDFLYSLFGFRYGSV